MTDTLDRRFFAFDVATRAADMDSRRVGGYAIRFHERADVGEFVEQIAPSAVQRSLTGTHQIRLLAEHIPFNLLATRNAGTLRLSVDPKGLRFEADIPQTSLGDEVLALVARGDYPGCSFGFVIPSARYQWTVDGDRRVGTLVDCVISEITISSNPAYAGTDVALRSAYAAYAAQQAPKGLPVAVARLKFRRGT